MFFFTHCQNEHTPPPPFPSPSLTPIVYLYPCLQDLTKSDTMRGSFDGAMYQGIVSCVTIFEDHILRLLFIRHPSSDFASPMPSLLLFFTPISLTLLCAVLWSSFLRLLADISAVPDAETLNAMVSALRPGSHLLLRIPVDVRRKEGYVDHSSNDLTNFRTNLLSLGRTPRASRWKWCVRDSLTCKSYWQTGKNDRDDNIPRPPLFPPPPPPFSLLLSPPLSFLLSLPSFPPFSVPPSVRICPD